jgi:molybdenum cofactor sulfurtransferase
LSRASVEFLAKQTGLDYQVVLERFRANFIIETMNGVPFEEDEFERIHIGSIAFKVRNLFCIKTRKFKVTGKCTRCQMICVDQETGQKDPNVLLALRDIRAGNKVQRLIAFLKILFTILKK